MGQRAEREAIVIGRIIKAIGYLRVHEVLGHEMTPDTDRDFERQRSSIIATLSNQKRQAEAGYPGGLAPVCRPRRAVRR